MEVKEYEELVGELELRVDRLRALYDQYFMGIEKTTPSVQHKDVERRVAMLRREQVRNTALRFRFQMLIQRYNTYQTYWQRICRQIEEGTYKRHVQRAKRKIAEQEQQRKDSGSFSIDVEFEDMEAAELLEPPEHDTEFFEPPGSVPPFPRSVPAPAVDVPKPADPAPIVARPDVAPVIVARPEVAPVVPRVVGAPGARVWKKVDAPGAAPPQPAPQPAPQPQAQPAPQPQPQARPAPQPQARPAPQPQPAPQPRAAEPPKPARPASPPLARSDVIPEARMRELYTKYVEAKRSRRESTAGLTYESLAQSIRESSQRLREKHGKSVDFEVSEKDGKTVLKPVIK